MYNNVQLNKPTNNTPIILNIPYNKKPTTAGTLTTTNPSAHLQ